MSRVLFLFCENFCIPAFWEDLDVRSLSRVPPKPEEKAQSTKGGSTYYTCRVLGSIATVE